MNQAQEQRLEEIFRKNENKKIAIAITGCWGVGKTFFWNKFRESYKLKNKYVYVSLFGLESLSDLKTHIYSNIENNHSALEVPRWIRGLPSILKDTRISQFGISASAKVFDSLMFNQVKEAVICFDDFERMSNKLDIKDVMGLANQLKLEKNCQIILILDEDKAEGENKKKYAEYKEKLIDETIKITSVEPLIRENTKDIDESLVDLMVNFADELEIHNFRFFQKVIKLYQAFREQLPEEVAYSTKKIILIRILQGYFIADFGDKYEFQWENIKLVLEEKQINWSERKIKTYEALRTISYNFIHSDEWLTEFRKWFDQVGELDFSLLKELVTSELLDENYQKAKENIERLMQQYKAYDIDSEFSKKLSNEIKEIIKFETIDNITFYCSILAEFNEMEEIKHIDDLVEIYLKNEFTLNRKKLLDKHYWYGNEKNKFRKYIKKLLDNPIYFQQDDFVKIIRLFIDRGEIAFGADEVLAHLTKENLEVFILNEYPQNFKRVSLKVIIEVILDLYNYQNFDNKRDIQMWIKEILEEQGHNKGFPAQYIKYFTENL